MDRCDGSLDVIFGKLRASGREMKQPPALHDEPLIPARSILIEKWDQVPCSVDARREPSRVKAHERRERVARWRCRGRVLEEQRCETNRLAAELDAHRRLARSMVALVEE